MANFMVKVPINGLMGLSMRENINITSDMVMELTCSLTAVNTKANGQTVENMDEAWLSHPITKKEKEFGTMEK